MDIEVIRRICLARHLYELGASSLRSANDLHLFSAVNLLQDAVEAFLLAVADFVGASLDERTNFDKYFVSINEKITPKVLPFKDRLLRLNRIRVSSKHHGIQPPRDECNQLVLVVREFFCGVSNDILHVNFATVSTIDLLTESETKDLLLHAKSALDAGELVECAISCRKAIYLELEQQYDVSNFKDSEDGRLVVLSFGALFTRAPHFAKTRQYVEKNVLDPTDYIVYDHNDLDRELLKYSIDTTDFWNIQSLTPSVYRLGGNWVVKYEFGKLYLEILKENIEYIFNKTTDIILTIHVKRAAIKTSESKRHTLELIQEEVPIYEKADTTSQVVAKSPQGFTRFDCDYHVVGLQGDGLYWHVCDLAHRLLGFIHNDYVR